MAKPFILLRLLEFETTVIDLVSPFRRDQCVHELRARVDDRWSFSGSQPVIGEVDDTTFTLRKRTGYRNSFRTILRGTFTEESLQTRIHCRIGVDPFARTFLFVWLAAVAIAAFVVLTNIAVVVPLGTSVGRTPPETILITLSMFCFGVALAKFGRYLARGEQQDLIEFVTQRLNARQTSTFDR